MRLQFGRCVRASSALVLLFSFPLPVLQTAAAETAYAKALFRLTDRANGVIAAPDGALYGTISAYSHTYPYGAVFKLAPPAPGLRQWSYSVLHMFNGLDGREPNSRLMIDAEGRLYGTTVRGGAFDRGTIFRLTPPAFGTGEVQWNMTVLHQFQDKFEGRNPTSAVIADAAGALYGTTAGESYHSGLNDGTVYKLTPPALGSTRWQLTTLHTFSFRVDGASPLSGLYADATGTLYGTTQEGAFGSPGTVFELRPPAAGSQNWIYSKIYQFKGRYAPRPSSEDPLKADRNGALYGVTTNGGIWGYGSVYRLTPPLSARLSWRQTALYSFKGGEDSATPVGVVVRANGTVYGTTAVSINKWPRTLFKLTPTADPDVWQKTVLYNYPAFSHRPHGSLVFGPDRRLYGTAGNLIIRISGFH